MELGLFTPVFGSLPFDQLLPKLKQYPAIKNIELGTGGWPGASHIDPEGLLADSQAAKDYLAAISDAGLSICALSCHNNPVHPDEAIASHEQAVVERTFRLAERLQVQVVVTFSGCPGGSADDKTPNWITAAWPPEFATALEWQWEERLIPYWKSAMQLASAAGVRVALEAHPGFCVYNPETLLRLRDATSPNLGINLDPSHMWWQSIHIPAAIEALKGAIFHFHAKDVVINPDRTAKSGVLDTKSYLRMAERSWLFRSVGWGHSELEWKAIISALRLGGYDGVVSIEHEDALASVDEGLSSAVAFLERVLLKQPAAEAWWV